MGKWYALSLAVWLCACVRGARARLWPRGVVHYYIQPADYDLHSQDEITSVFSALEREVCVKFFQAPAPAAGGDNPTASGGAGDMVLLVRNPRRLADCLPQRYDYTGAVVDMPIGYRCINRKDITRIVVDMLRASIDPGAIRSYDMLKQYQDRAADGAGASLLAAEDRNYINSYYYAECGALSARPFPAASRRASEVMSEGLSPESAAYYGDKLWPLGVVMYSVAPELRGHPLHSQLKTAMTALERASCVVFQFADADDVLAPKNILHFGAAGAEGPALGFTEGNQTIRLLDMVEGAPAHTAHALNNLLRALGVPMMSNRFDRDNYVSINWGHVIKGKQHYLEKSPEAAWIQSVAYDFDSATHAPANYLCVDCNLGAQSVQPVQDPLWARSLSMGHRAQLSAGDRETLALLYGKECQRRFA